MNDVIILKFTNHNDPIRRLLEGKSGIIKNVSREEVVVGFNPPVAAAFGPIDSIIVPQEMLHGGN